MSRCAWRLNTSLLLLANASLAWAHYQTLNFDITKDDPQAYTTDIPAGAFTPNGLKLEVKPGVQYSLTSNRVFADEFDFELQIEVLGRSEQGDIIVELVLVNDEARRKVVGTYINPRRGDGSDRAEFRYFKDGKAVGLLWEGQWRDASHTTGYQGQEFSKTILVETNDPKHRVLTLFITGTIN